MNPITRKILSTLGYACIVHRSGVVMYKLPVYRRLVNSHTEVNPT